VIKIMVNQIPKQIKAISRSISSTSTSGGCRSGATTQTRCRLRRFGQRAITSNSNHRSFSPTNETPFHLRFNIIGNNLEMRRTRVTVVDSISGLHQQSGNHVPQPTWSVQDLELESTHIPITQQELDRLARLVLVDMSENSSNCDDETIDSLKQDLGDMLHMIQHVTEHDCQESIGKDVADARDNNHDDKDDPIDSATIYDTARGVRGIPLRKAIEEDPLQAQDASQAQVISETILHSKMVRRGGGHKYFAIETIETQE
jgi:hypothetical protein